MIEYYSLPSKNSKNTEYWAGRVLRLGVLVSGSLLISGLFLSILFPSSIHALSNDHSLGIVLSMVFSQSFNPLILLYAGLFLLMLTPVLRVLTVTVVFAVERDRRFVVVSTLVFILLISEIVYSLFIQ